MPGLDQLIEQFLGSDPIAGRQALHELLAAGDSGEEALFARSIEFPRTTQARRRWLQYVASRESSVVGRLVDRMRYPDRFKDAYSAAHLFAGTGKNLEVTAHLFSQIRDDFSSGDYESTSDRFVAYGYAGGLTAALWNLITEDRHAWEKLGTFAFRGACGAFARINDGDWWAIERLVSHEWRTYELTTIEESSDDGISHDAIEPQELWLQANEPFMIWRRGQVADEVLDRCSEHSHWRARDFAAQVLASLGFQRTVASVIEWLRLERVQKIRGSLLHALERSETSAGADALIDHYSSSKQEGRHCLARAAWRASDKDRAAAELRAIVARGGFEGAEALVSCARLGHRPDQIDDMLDSRNYYHRLNAALAVAYLGERSASSRLVAMRSEAAAPLERICLAAALAMLGNPNGAAELNEALVATAAARDYDDRIDVFRLHRYLQTAILDGLATGGEQSRDLLSAWRTELEPLDPVPRPVVPEKSKSPSAPPRPSPPATILPRGEHGPPTRPRPDPLTVFVSYSHKDEKLREKLGQHLAPLVSDGLIRIWHDREIEAGANWEKDINDEIGAADIILLLVSASFLASRYCRKELLRALDQRAAGRSLPIPIILRHCDWTSVFNRDEYKTQALPRDGRPVAGGGWPNQDAALAAVAKELRAQIERMLTSRS